MAYCELTLGPLTIASASPSSPGFSPSFDLVDGGYWVDLVDPTVTDGEWYLQKLGADGSTWFMVQPSVFLQVGSRPGADTTTQHLPRGTYRFILYSGSAAAAYFNVTRLWGE